MSNNEKTIVVIKLPLWGTLGALAAFATGTMIVRDILKKGIVK